MAGKSFRSQSFAINRGSSRRTMSTSTTSGRLSQFRVFRRDRVLALLCILLVPCIGLPPVIAQDSSAIEKTPTRRQPLWPRFPAGSGVPVLIAPTDSGTDTDDVELLPPDEEDESLPIDPVRPNGTVTPPTLPDPIDDYTTYRITPGSGLTTRDAAAVRLAISADALDMIFQKEQLTRGEVNDCILGARVHGQQSTETKSHLELVPDEMQATFEVVLDGLTSAETFGATNIAGIVSSSDSRFEMRKRFSFDGRQFRTSSPAATVWPNQTNHAAVPLRGNVPVLRRIIGSLAYNEAERRRPAAQQITAYRVTEDASSKFNSRVDDALGKLQADWAGKVIPLAERHLPALDFPIARTTATHAIFALPSPWARANEDLLGADWVERGDSISFAVHESALRAGIERLNLGGFEIGPGDYDNAIRKFAPGVVDGSPPSFLGQTGSLVLDEDEPAYVTFRDGKLNAVLNAAIKTPVGQLPTQRITMPWTFAADDQSVYCDPGPATVEPINGDTNPLMAAVRPFIVAQLAQELLPLRMPREVTLPTQSGDQKFRLRFQDLRCRNGWLVLGWQVIPDESDESK